jgi:hypothetical protein
MRTNRMKSVLASITLTAAAALLLFPESQARAADPTTADCLAASDASLKLGNEHKLRADRSQLLVCAAASCPADIRKECVSRVAEVNAQIPTIIFAARDAMGADLSAVKVTMDGEVVAERLEGSAISIDPGDHTFTFETAAQSPVTKKFLIQQAQKDRREAITFGTAASGAAPPTPQPGASPASTPAAEPSHGMGTQKILALVAGGVGVIGLGVGTAFGVIAMSQKSTAQSACPNQCATSAGVNDWSTAESSGTISTVGFIVGGVGIAGAAVLWFTAPSSSGGGSTQVGLGPSGLQVKGVW